ncbi:MAG: FKBP-type peptidyl-prolyl cis-trans isomerase [Bacteroidetes bacterium]|nr:FKBP-type peptidyl-prolyl cis-trans isomerase [Bacteroidota bacterium]
MVALPLAACSSKSGGEELESVELKNSKDKLSYSLGAEQARMITQSGDPNFDKLDKDAMVRGFLLGVKSKQTELSEDCRKSLQKLYGPYGQDFDSTAVIAGSECIGQMAGSIFYNGWSKKGALDKIDLNIAKIGFQHGLYDKDTLVEMTERSALVATFVEKLNKKSGSEMMANAKKLPNTKEIEGGIIIQTINEGKGGMPQPTDDVKADYSLTNASGDTLESSIAMRRQNPEAPVPAFNLQGVIQGWTKAFPNLKKGGQYRVFIPWNLAYGEQGGFESLCFYIDFQDFGAAGTLAQPRQ